MIFMCDQSLLLYTAETTSIDTAFSFLTQCHKIYQMYVKPKKLICSLV